MNPAQFQHQVRQSLNNLIGNLQSDDISIGVALSGGSDSVALLLALKAEGYNLVALHCNFHLRGNESDEDELFCRNLATRLSIPIHVLQLDTLALKQHGESVEMACRRLRYEWFENQAHSLGLEAIAIAHHRDDNIETVMLNLFRGTGINGLCGIPPRRGIYVRPMLDIPHAEIVAYLKAAGQSWRTDSTNATDEYRRNAIRNAILPLVREYFPDADRTISATVRNASEARDDLHEYVGLLMSQSGKNLTDSDSMDITPFIGHPHLLTIAVDSRWHLNINHSVAGDILRSSGTSETAMFNCTDGTQLMLQGSILSKLNFTGLPLPKLKYEKFDSKIFPGISYSSDAIYLDADAIPTDADFNLRYHLTGDRMRPFGMKGSKLVSDILKEGRIPPHRRHYQPILTMGEDILWVVGIRASALYNVTNGTKSILKISIDR